MRAHLQEIAGSFSKGDFTIPSFVHGKAPDGIAAMRKQKGKIQYVYEELPAGGRVNIRTREKKALQAVQEFLRFQITEHQTGDLLTVPQSRVGFPLQGDEETWARDLRPARASTW